ncbi:MAG: hypothetical protein O2825_15385, partial [Proteobacteria bacterium]|nr:hypothetical protein [Pseudomonadota bacterium]
GGIAVAYVFLHVLPDLIEHNAVLAGWLLGVAWELPEAAVSLIFAFLTGSVIMNVIKDELPAEHDSRVLPFVLGAGLYAAIVLAV